MIIDNAVLTLDELYAPTGGPAFVTKIQEWGDGSEQRLQCWEYPLSVWQFGGRKLAYSKAIRTWPEIQAFFSAREGKQRGFYYFDWVDYQGINQGIGVGDGTRTQFQIVKTYPSFATALIRKIYRIVQDSLTVRLNDAIFLDYSVNLLTGLITFNDPVPNGTTITADFEFYVPARFLTDSLESRLLTEHDTTILELGRIAMGEIRL